MSSHHNHKFQTFKIFTDILPTEERKKTFTLNFPELTLRVLHVSQRSLNQKQKILCFWILTVMFFYMLNDFIVRASTNIRDRKLFVLCVLHNGRLD